MMMKSFYSKLHKKLVSWVLGGLLGLSACLPVPAEAVDAWAVAAQALGVYGAYKSSLSAILSLGNEPAAQMQSRMQDLAQNGKDPNRHDVEIVDAVMKQLVQQGDYALKPNSLPFVWSVNNSDAFNAACYPTNYVSVNRALVRGLECEIDELAAVLAHEMTHGLEQHSAQNYAKAVAQYYGMSFLNMDMGLMDWNKLNMLANYSIAKNVTLPTEYDADEGGFYLMASAGFNPGGPAAAMARMGYYLTYETQNVFEYQDPDPKERERENFSDHPKTDLRELKLAKMLTDYSAGHVAVVSRRDIYIDGGKLLSVDWTREDYDNTPENAYFVAGALAKAFHELNSAEEWNFRREGKELTCLDNSRVNAALHEFLSREQAGERLQELVLRAYDNEKYNNARVKMLTAASLRRDKIRQAREEALAANKKFVKKMRENADVYNDFGEGELALVQMQRSFAAKNQENEAESYGIRGRAKAVTGDYAGALADADKAVALDSNNIYNLLNRADVQRMAGNREGALADCEQAKLVNGKNPYSWLISAQIYEEKAEHEAALSNYREFHRLLPKAFRHIPEEYLKDISEKDYKTLQKEKQEAEKQQAEEEK